MADSNTISCEEALRRLAEFVDHELADAQRGEMERHLHVCQNCYSRVEFERRLKEQLSGLAPRDVPVAAANRIKALLKGLK